MIVNPISYVVRVNICMRGEWGSVALGGLMRRRIEEVDYRNRTGYWNNTTGCTVINELG